MIKNLLLCLMLFIGCDPNSSQLWRNNPQIDENTEMPGQRPSLKIGELEFGSSSFYSSEPPDGYGPCKVDCIDIDALLSSIADFFTPTPASDLNDDDIEPYTGNTGVRYGEETVWWNNGHPTKHPDFIDRDRLDQLNQENVGLEEKWDENKAAMGRRDLLKQAYEQKLADFHTLKPLTSSSQNYPVTLQKISTAAVASHNSEINSILDEFPKSQETDLQNQSSFATDPNTPEGRQIRTAYNYARYVEAQVNNNPNATEKAIGQKLVSGAKTVIATADKKFSEGNIGEGQFALDIATKLLDIALSLTPGISWGKDLYEACTGTNLVTGDKLSDWERGFAILGVVTVGIGSKLGKASKAMEIAGDVVKAADKGLEAERAVVKAEKVVDSAKKIGLKNADEIKDYGKFSSWKSSNPSKSGWNPKRNGSLDSTENAFQHYGKHKSDFPEYKSAQDYVEGANDFVSNPPTGTLTKNRAHDGTIIYYHEPTNRISFSTNGKPDSYFKPADGRSYYNGL